MGDRANIHVRNNARENGIYFYTHWSGSELPETLRQALIRSYDERWDDPPYLNRIIFAQMIKGDESSLSGFGIDTELGDGADRIIEVNHELQTVTIKGKTWSFEEYIVLENAGWND